MQAARLAEATRSLQGWRRWLLAFCAGLVSVLALAPFHVWPVLLLTLPALVWLLDGAEGTIRPSIAPIRRAIAPRAAAAVGWWMGFGYFLAGLFWIGEAFLVEADRFAALMPFAVVAMPVGLALFWAAACATAVTFWRAGPTRLLVLALALTSAEWVRGHVLTGFPWNVLGYALTYPDILLQSASLVGIYGLTLVAVPMLGGPLVILADHGRRAKYRGTVLLISVMTCLPLGAMLAWGAYRLAIAEPLSGTHQTVRIVQPSIPQREKWKRENQQWIFDRHIALSQRSPGGVEDGARGIALVIWPEAAMPFLPLHSPAALAAIGRMLPAGTHLLSGALRLDEPAGGGRRVYNSLLGFGAGGAPIAVYDKIHLVPFGEYLPLQTWLEAIGLQQLVHLPGGFEPGRSPRPLLEIAGLPRLGPLICYEVIFPRRIVQGAQRPDVLINVTNDGWFGNTTGPRQHLHQSRVRAAEEGLPLVRAANNGISALIDARGRIIARLELDVAGSLDAVLPAALPPPPYARFGDWILLGMVIVVSAVTWVFGSERRKDDKQP